MEWAARIACLAVWLSLSRVDGSAVLLALVLARSLHIDFPPRHPDSETRIRRLPLHSSLSSPRPPALPPPHRLVQAVSPCHARLATALRSALPVCTHPCLLAARHPHLPGFAPGAAHRKENEQNEPSRRTSRARKESFIQPPPPPPPSPLARLSSATGSVHTCAWELDAEQSISPYLDVA